MATNTPNLGLTKPATTEAYSVGVQNANMDKIDAAVDGLNKSVDELKSLQVSDVSLKPNSNYNVASAAWYVKSGICFVRFDVTVIARSEGWTIAGTGVPIPVYRAHRGVASSTIASVAGLGFQVNSEGSLIFSAGQAGVRYWGEFSYPI